jgi:hypothetical protein
MDQRPAAGDLACARGEGKMKYLLIAAILGFCLTIWCVPARADTDDDVHYYCYLAPMKFDPNGNHLWTTTQLINDWTESYSVEIGGLEIDSAGNSYLLPNLLWMYETFIAGLFKYTADGSFDDSFHPENKQPGAIVTQGNELYVTGYDGDLLEILIEHVGVWTVSYPLNAYAWQIAVDASGNVFVAGGSGWEDILLLKYDPAGNLQWAKICNFGGWDIATRLLLDSLGQPVVVGYPWTEYRSIQPIITAKYDGEGNELWRAQYDGGGGDWRAEIVDAEIDSSDSVVVAANVGGTETNDRTPLILKYESAGNLLWDNNFQGTSFSVRPYKNLGIDAQGNIYVAYKGFHPSPFAIKLSPDGSVQWRIENEAFDNPIAVDSAGSMFVADSVGKSTFLLKKFDTNGNLVWQASAAIDESEDNWLVPGPVVLDESGNAIIANSYIRDIAVDDDTWPDDDSWLDDDTDDDTDDDVNDDSGNDDDNGDDADDDSVPGDDDHGGDDSGCGW